MHLYLCFFGICVIRCNIYILMLQSSLTLPHHRGTCGSAPYKVVPSTVSVAVTQLWTYCSTSGLVLLDKGLNTSMTSMVRSGIFAAVSRLALKLEDRDRTIHMSDRSRKISRADPKIAQCHHHCFCSIWKALTS